METQAKIKEIVIISGKGGTGKTTISAALAHIVQKKVMADADVDAANLHILLKPQNAVRHPFEGKPVASIDKEICNRCGLCFRLCRFNAISAKYNDYYVDHMACEACIDKTPRGLGFFERYLTLWVGLCIVAGISLGRVAPGVPGQKLTDLSISVMRIREVTAGRAQS